MPASAAHRAQDDTNLFLALLGAIFGPVWQRISHAPLTSAAVVIVAAGYLVTTLNALYWQDPALKPVETASVNESAALTAPPPARPATIREEPRIDTASTQSMQAPAPTEIAPARRSSVEIPGPVLGDETTFRVQTMLKALGLFSAEIDGYYGPNTANAIRAFEERSGLPAKGALEPDMIEALERAYMTGQLPAAQRSVVTPTPEPVIEPAATASRSEPASSEWIAVEQPAAETTQSAQTTQSNPVETPAPVAEPAAEPANDPLADIARTAMQEMPPAIEQQATPATNPELVMKIQRGLASLGFLYGAIDGKAGDATARAIRQFEIFSNLDVTGEISPELVDLLQAAGATI
jgi:peptidoglycan hydrolase-like protein with peptidoglycan-binding domain